MSARTMIASLCLAAAVVAISNRSEPPFSIRAFAHGNHTFAAGEPGDPKRPFRIVEIVMTDGPGTMAYAPAQLEIRRGEQIKFLLKNVGLVDHEFLIDSFANNAKHRQEMEKHADMQHHEPNGARLKPGTTSEILWRFSKAGTFEFACLIPGHYETGMKGTFVVK